MGTAPAIPTGIEMTARELGQLPRGRARFELVAGELLIMEPGFAEHGIIAIEAGGVLRNHVRERDLGIAFGAETGFLLTQAPGTVRAPDAAFVSHATAARAGKVKGYWPGRPGAGCTLVLVLQPETRTATAFRHATPPTIHGAGETIDCGDAVPCLRPRVAELFP